MAKNKLHPGARWIFRIRGYASVLFIVIFLTLFLSGVVFSAGNLGSSFGAYALFSLMTGIVLVIIIAEIYARMAYNRWFYEFTEDNLKLEKGIIWKQYSNVPYERVQNVDIRRGILARMLGFSSVHIQTAGYSAYPSRPGMGMGAEGGIPAISVEGAEKIREFLMKKIGKRAKGGL